MKVSVENIDKQTIDTHINSTVLHPVIHTNTTLKVKSTFYAYNYDHIVVKC